MKNMKKAFTLAEILIVVAIIGVVAAMAIPNLNKSVNEEKYALLYRSTTEQLNAALGKLISEYGSYNKAGQVNCSASKTSYFCATQKLTNYLDVGLNCGTTNMDKCFHLGDLTIMGDDSNTVEVDDCDYAFVLANGVAVCDRAGAYEIDLDGPNNGPNSRGIDLFRLDMQNGSLQPMPSYEAGGKESETYVDFVNYDRYNKWFYEIGNMDYLKCPDHLNWINKHTCED